jgi:L-alanine-DL-glutamate epimerase-like enolase superfamily enzyme
LRIKQVEVYLTTLRYREPFRIASGTSEVSRNVLLRVLTDDGIEGLGESSPSRRVTGETPETVLGVLSRIAPRLIGMCPLRTERIAELIDSVASGNPAAKAAVDMALHDILGKASGKQLFLLLGGYRTEVMTDVTLGIKSPLEMARDAVQAVKTGFRALKVKVGTDPLEDVERVRRVRGAVGDSIEIRVDANQGWRPEQAAEVLRRIEEFNVQFVEQPVPAGDIDALAEVRRCSTIPVMADESVCSPEDALSLIRKEAADLINIKLMKSGGLLKARQIAEVAEAAGIPCMIGCMGESGVGISAAAHLAGGLRNIKYADLDSDLLQVDKLVKRGGAGLVGSARVLPEYEGIGVEELDLNLLGRPVAVYR